MFGRWKQCVYHGIAIQFSTTRGQPNEKSGRLNMWDAFLQSFLLIGFFSSLFIFISDSPSSHVALKHSESQECFEIQRYSSCPPLIRWTLNKEPCMFSADHSLQVSIGHTGRPRSVSGCSLSRLIETLKLNSPSSSQLQSANVEFLVSRVSFFL